jgi:hypothetical protein
VTDVTVPAAVVTPSSDGRLTLRFPSLLGVTAATDNLTLDYQLLLDRFRFIRHSQIQVDIHIYIFIKI